MKTKIMPPTYFMILLFLSIGFHFVLPIKKIIYAPYSYLGILLIFFGIAINIWADYIFKKRKTTVKTHKMPTHFETAGPFSITRHPMYLGMAAALFGVGIYLGSLITFLCPIIFIILMEALFIPAEEKNLEKIFGEKYLNYKRKVRRWI